MDFASSSSSAFMGRFGSKHLEKIQNEDELHSGLNICSEEETPANSALIEKEEPNPSVNWRLPPVSPSEVYRGLTPFNLRAYSQIKIKEKSIKTELNLNTMMTIPMFEIRHIQAARKAGYQYAHLGMVRVGLNALHRKGQKAYVFSALFDNRWSSFTQALIGGIETSLSDGPVQYDVFPDFSVALDDVNILQCLTLGIQTQGYENFKSKSKNLAIFYITCVRFYNTTIPAVLHTPDKDDGKVTLIQYDSSCNPIFPSLCFKKTSVSSR